jgi:hypothetical protein
VNDRLPLLRDQRKEAADEAAKCSVKAPLGRVPKARCTSLLLAAASAQGRVSGYGFVGSRVSLAKLRSTAAATRALAARLRALAPKAPAKERARALGQAKTADAAAAVLARSAKGLVAVQRNQATWARSARAAQAKVTACKAK